MSIEIVRAGRKHPAPGTAASPMRTDGATVVESAGFGPMPGALHGQGRTVREQPHSILEAGASGIHDLFGQSINEPTPLFGGTAEAGNLVLVGVGGAVFCVTADARGAWSLDTASAAPMSGRFDLGADGPKELLVTSVDPAGNSRGIAGFFVLDTVPPPPPVLETTTVDRTAPMLRGLAEAASTVTVGLCGAIYTVPADAGGRWCLNLHDVPPVSGTLVFGPDGEGQVVLACSDAAGNTSTAEGVFRLCSQLPKAARPLLAQEPSAALLAGVADTTRRLLASLAGRALRPMTHVRESMRGRAETGSKLA